MLGFCSFCDQFEDPNHQDFTYKAKELLYEYFCENNLNLEVQAVDLCTEYNEYTWDECVKEFNIDLSDIDDDDDEDDAIQKLVKEYLDENTIVVGTTADSIVYVSF